MDREAKYRGKRIDNDEWISGYFIDHGSHCQIHIKDSVNEEDIDTGWVDVIRSTVGQFVDLQDKNNIDLFEDDIVTFTRGIGNWSGKTMTTTHLIFWNKETCSFCISTRGGYQKLRRLDGRYIYELIGTKHDNPDLLELVS